MEENVETYNIDPSDPTAEDILRALFWFASGAIFCHLIYFIISKIEQRSTGSFSSVASESEEIKEYQSNPSLQLSLLERIIQKINYVFSGGIIMASATDIPVENESLSITPGLNLSVESAPVGKWFEEEDSFWKVVEREVKIDRIDLINPKFLKFSQSNGTTKTQDHMEESILRAEDSGNESHLYEENEEIDLDESLTDDELVQLKNYDGDVSEHSISDIQVIPFESTEVKENDLEQKAFDLSNEEIKSYDKLQYETAIKKSVSWPIGTDVIMTDVTIGEDNVMESSARLRYSAPPDLISSEKLETSLSWPKNSCLRGMDISMDLKDNKLRVIERRELHWIKILTDATQQIQDELHDVMEDQTSTFSSKLYTGTRYIFFATLMAIAAYLTSLIFKNILTNDEIIQAALESLRIRRDQAINEIKRLTEEVIKSNLRIMFRRLFRTFMSSRWPEKPKTEDAKTINTEAN